MLSPLCLSGVPSVSLPQSVCAEGSHAAWRTSASKVPTSGDAGQRDIAIVSCTIHLITSIVVIRASSDFRQCFWSVGCNYTRRHSTYICRREFAPRFTKSHITSAWTGWICVCALPDCPVESKRSVEAAWKFDETYCIGT